MYQASITDFDNMEKKMTLERFAREVSDTRFRSYPKPDRDVGLSLKIVAGIWMGDL